MRFPLLYLLCLIGIKRVTSDGQCDRPLDMKSKEEYCFSTEVEIVERVVQKSKSLLNFVKEKIGIGEIEETQEPQTLNGNSYPVYKNIKDWTEEHATYKQTLEFIKQLDKCNEALTNSKLSETYFDADLDGTKRPTADIDVKQNTCEIASEFIKCLSKNQECPVFTFP